MAQQAILSHPDVAAAGINRRAPQADWSPRTKFLCFIGCATACWGLVLAPFFLLG